MRRTNIICIASHKGGVGKTTTAATLGSMLASKGQRVLLVDLDAQRNLTSTFLGSAERPELTLYDAFMGQCRLPVVKVRERLDIVPATLSLGTLDVAIAAKLQREMILRNLLKSVVMDYDWIFLDCPSQMGMLTINALAAATSLIVPVSCDAYSAEGLMQLQDVVEMVANGVNPLLDLDGIIITRFHTRRSLDRIVEEDLRKAFRDLVFPTVIRENATVVQAPVMGRDIFTYDSRCNGALDYAALLDDICRKMEEVARGK